jgi:uncharacterized membrane protein
MSDLIAIAYDNRHQAEEVRLTLVKLQKEHLIELDDAAVVVKAADGTIQLKQALDLTASGAVSGGFWGLLIGSLFFSPLFGAVVGATSGAISGALTDIGVNDDFMRELGKSLMPDSSALFILVRQMTPDKVIDELAPFGGKVLRTSLTKDQEASLKQVLTDRGLITTATQDVLAVKG